MGESFFGPGLMKFLSSLTANNNRDWFLANKERYEAVMLEPALEFVEAFAPHLRAFAPNYIASARRTGGSLFRINRDVRFAKDKSPYKTHLGIRFLHKDAKEVAAPVYYLHIEPRGSFAGVGIMHPDPKTLGAIRQTIVQDPQAWKRAAHGSKFGQAFELTGDSLQRPPKGFDPDHPMIEDLKRKDFVAMATLPDKVVTSETLLSDFAKLCRSADGFMKFLCGAAGVRF